MSADPGRLGEAGHPVDRLVLATSTSRMAKPATSSLASAYGPSVTVGLPPSIDDPGGGLTRPDAAGQEDVAGLRRFDHERADGAHLLRGRRDAQLLGVVDATGKVLHGGCSFRSSGRSIRPSTHTSNRAWPKSTWPVDRVKDAYSGHAISGGDPGQREDRGRHRGPRLEVRRRARHEPQAARSGQTSTATAYRSTVATVSGDVHGRRQQRRAHRRGRRGRRRRRRRHRAGHRATGRGRPARPRGGARRRARGAPPSSRRSRTATSGGS